MRQAKLITIQIETSGAAFDDHEMGETCRILRTLCRELSTDPINAELLPGQNGLYEINGNTCGNVKVERADDMRQCWQCGAEGGQQFCNDNCREQYETIK